MLRRNCAETSSAKHQIRFGEFDFPAPLAVGDQISLLNAGGYTMVKKNWFNGVAMPAIAIRRKNGAIDLVKEFDYADYVASLS